MVWINTYNMFNAASPFGGYKQSGYGREMGKHALDLYTHVKSVWVDLSGKPIGWFGKYVLRLQGRQHKVLHPSRAARLGTPPWGEAKRNPRGVPRHQSPRSGRQHREMTSCRPLRGLSILIGCSWGLRPRLYADACFARLTVAQTSVCE